MIDYELGDVIFWLSFDGGEPFPLNIYQKKGQWCHKVHIHLTAQQRKTVDRFAQERIKDLQSLWRTNMKQRLRWEK